MHRKRYGRYHATTVFDIPPARSHNFSIRGSIPTPPLLILYLMATVCCSYTRGIDEIDHGRTRGPSIDCTLRQPQDKPEHAFGGGANNSLGTSISPHRKIYFQHVHKAGGTTMCAMAGLANEFVGVKNCNSDPALGPANGLKEYARLRAEKHALKLAGKPTKSVPAPGFIKTQQLLRGSREEQCRFFRNTPLTFIANEAPSPNAVLTVPGVFRFTMLRHPYDRHVSEFNHCLKKQCVGKFARSDFVRWLDGKKGTHANFQTRVILGDASYDRPLVASDIMLAKERLQTAYSLVLILEEFEPRGRLLLSKRLGWKVDAITRGSHHHSNATAELLPEQLVYLQENNAVDLKIYRFAQRLFNNYML